MTCSRCKKKELIELPYIQQKLCPDCFTKFFEKRVRRTIRCYNLLETEDRTAIALSGGKDSMTVLTILKSLSKKAPKSKLFAIMVDEGSPGYRDKLIKTAANYCEKIEVPYHIYSFKEELGMTIIDIMKKAEKLGNPMPACTYCGVFRRQLLNQKARELGATKIATGHNLDDECQTALMNFLKGDAYRIARAGAMVGVIKNKLFVSRIKPLRETPESEVKLYTELKNIPTTYASCPLNKDAFRVYIKKLLNEMEVRYPGIKYQILGSVDEIIPILRGHYYGLGESPSVCKKCGEVSSSDECKFCQLKKALGL